MTRCPPWCTSTHPAADPSHRGETFAIPVVLEGRGHGGAQPGELLIEVSRHSGEAAVWVYLGDGWTGFSLSWESATRVSSALRTALRSAGTIDSAGL